MKELVMHVVLAVGVVLFVAGVVLGAPLAASALALSFAGLWSWVALQALVGLVLGGVLTVHSLRELDVV